jgi:hypothetical protein
MVTKFTDIIEYWKARGWKYCIPYSQRVTMHYDNHLQLHDVFVVGKTKPAWFNHVTNSGK